MPKCDSNLKMVLSSRRGNIKIPDNIFCYDSNQRCKVRIRFILYILYIKVYNSSCSQVGHDLIDRIKTSPEQIKITASICKYILCDDGSAAFSGKDAVNMVYQIVPYLTAVPVVYLVIQNI